MLERLSSRGYLVVATPYQLSFDHLTTCDEIIGRFELVAPDLAKPVPVVGVGHSCGALLHMLITSLFPDTPRAANALISYNNRGVSEAVPLFKELVVPLFSDGDRNGSELMKAMIEVAREQINGEVPSDDALRRLVRSLPGPIPGLSLENILPSSLVSIPPPIRESLTRLLTGPVHDALSNAPGNVPSLLLQSLGVAAQVPKLIDEVEGGARDFTPTPDAMSSAARRAYRCRRTMILQFEDDALDDSPALEGYLREAESVMKMKRPMITINLERRVLEGNHLTPLLGPSGGEGWGEALEETLGGIVGMVGGSSSGGGGGNDGEESAKVVREKLGYEQNKSVTNHVIKNKDVRSESVDSFSSTVDVRHDSSRSFCRSKETASSDAICEFILVQAKKGDHRDNDIDDAADDDDAPSQPLPPEEVNRLSRSDETDEKLLHIRMREKALSSIVVLSSASCPRARALLDAHDGHLIDVGPHILAGLRDAAPSRLAARVGDYNENMFYEMQAANRDIRSIILDGQRRRRGGDSDDNGDEGIAMRESSIQRDIEAFEASIRQSLRQANLSYRGSYMTTERTMFQPAHVDYDYDILRTYGKRLYLSFFPLTEEGAFLQLWLDPIVREEKEAETSRDNDDNNKDGRKVERTWRSFRDAIEGTVVFIPHGKMLIVPSDTIHGGGFKHGSGGNLRFHLYIALEEDESDADISVGDVIATAETRKERNRITLLDHPMNKYTERHDRRRELCERFVDSNGLDCLLGNFFEV
ncbi:hypothetical protein ACHAW5_003708 [Stephanodiscus triporus]|uniref:Uncharacterized protein n=1 Tax=Stephanodiscus triporus TaxID=2934178 RepID=A0ABD3QI06_9STRA